MRSKDEILAHLEQAYIGTSCLAERQLMSVNRYLEVLIDIRDILKDLSRIIAVRTGSTDIS